MPLTAMLVDCTTGPTGAAAPDERLRELAGWYASLDVTAIALRLSDDAAHGTDTDAANHEWTALLDQLGTADIVVMALPHSAGPRSGVAELVIARVTGGVAPGDVHERYPLFNKVGAVIAALGDEGTSVAEMLATLAALGCTAAPGTDLRSLATSTVHLAKILRENPLPESAEDDAKPLPRKLFGNLPTGSLAIDPAAVEAELRAAAEGRLIDRRRTFDLTRREKGLPEKRTLPRPPFPPAGDQPES
ncbi:MAG: hypothetical protein ABIM89_11615 [Mycobacteriales bacterium]